MKPIILVVEDELEVQEGIQRFLENAGYEVDVASDGLDGLYKSQQKNYDLILLDVLMPKIDGYAVLEFIRKSSDVPIIMLTAMGAEENQIRGFELNVNDYIVKPFSMNILLKRIEVIFRMHNEIKKDDKKNVQLLTYKEISVNLDDYTVTVSERRITLTDKEFELLELLMKFPNKVFTRDDLLHQLWGDDYGSSDYLVTVHIANLRKKISVDYIKTFRGKGYSFVTEDKEQFEY